MMIGTAWEDLLMSIELPKKNDKTYIWGAGNTAVLAHQGMIRENLYHDLHVIAYLDSKLAGEKINGYPIIHPSEISEEDTQNIFILICTANQWMYEEIADELIQRKIRFCLLDAAIIKLKKEMYERVISLLDDASKTVYKRMLAKRITLEPIDGDLYFGESYFGIPEFCSPKSDDVIIDIGAYVGDSVERYIWRMDTWKRIIAIEPDRGNYTALCNRIKRLNSEWNLTNDRIVALFAGLDEKTNYSYMQTRVGGLSSIKSETSSENEDHLTFWALDDLLKEKGWDNEISYIKADIESYEYRMLLGAQRCILHNHPRMAICIYHNAVDMYSIPLLINNMDKTYNFSVKHHSHTLAETVLYVY